MPSTRKKTKYVLCHGPMPEGSGHARVRVYVYPDDLVKTNPLTVLITGTALSTKILDQEKIYEHEKAWAAGYYVIEAIVEGRANTSEPLGIDSSGLGDYIFQAANRAEAHLAVWCPDCAKPVRLPGGQLSLQTIPPYPQNDGLIVKCDSCKRQVPAARADIAYLVIPLPPTLE